VSSDNINDGGVQIRASLSIPYVWDLGNTRAQGRRLTVRMMALARALSSP
jgi:hypothetical protein